MDVVVDTDILSKFAKVNKLKLLSRLFSKSRILICPSVNLEIRKGVELGLLRYSHPPHFIGIKLSTREKTTAREAREALNLGSGDAECLAFARNRNCLLLTNDREAEKAADSFFPLIIPRDLKIVGFLVVGFGKRSVGGEVNLINLFNDQLRLTPLVGRSSQKSGPNALCPPQG